MDGTYLNKLLVLGDTIFEHQSLLRTPPPRSKKCPVVGAFTQLRKILFKWPTLARGLLGLGKALSSAVGFMIYFPFTASPKESIEKKANRGKKKKEK